MKIKFVDSKLRTRTIIGDMSPKELYDEAVIQYSPKYTNFEEEIENFVSTLDPQELAKAKEEISAKTDVSAKKIKDREAVVGDIKILIKYLRYLDQNFSDKKLTAKGFKWNENFVRNFDTASPTAPRKLVSYKSISNNFKKFGIDDLDTAPEIEQKKAEVYSASQQKYIEMPYNICTAYLVGTEGAFDKLVEFIKDKCMETLKPAEGSKSSDYSKGEYLKRVEEIQNESKEKEDELNEDIKDLEKRLANKDYEDEDEKAELESYLEEDKNDLAKLLEKKKILLENEKNEFEGNFDIVITTDDIKKICFFDLDEGDVELLIGTPRPEDFIQGNRLTKDSKDWCGVKGLKLDFKFENSKLVKDNKSVGYFVLNKELEKHYYDSKPTLSYEDWLNQNKELINDTFEKMCRKEAKPMNDSLKNLKFRFNDGVVIEVLDSEGKSFDEVKKEAIAVHRQLLNKSSVNDDKKETEEVLEDLGAKATNDSCEDVSPETQEKLDKAEINTADSVEETSNDKFKVTVNGKEIGIFDTYEEAEEAEKKALEAVEKGIPKVNTEDCDNISDAEPRAYEDDKEQAAYENAIECLTYGVGKSDWDSCDLPEDKASEIWRKAFKDLANKM